MRRRALFAMALCAALIGSAAAVTAEVDPFVGTWVLDRQQSRYEADAVPERMVIVMTATAQGVHYRSDARYAEGRSAVSEYTAEYDGMLAMVFGSAGILAPVSLKRIDANTVEASYFLGLRVVASARRVVSREGRALTITTTSRDAAGQSRTNVAVFERAL